MAWFERGRDRDSSAGDFGSVAVDPNGNIDPGSFYETMRRKVSSAGLAGQAPAWGQQFGITSGHPDEWARFFTMLQKQESGHRLAPVNPDGSLQRFPTTPYGEKSYGPGQFNVGEYGLKTWNDVNDPNKVADAYIRVAQSGKIPAYFGSVQRPNEVMQHRQWFDRTIGAQPQTDGQNAMAGAYPWNLVQWPNGVDPQAGDLNPGMTPGPLVRPQPGMPGMFASVPPQDAPQAAPPMPPPQGPQGGAAPRSPMAMGMGTPEAPQQSDNMPGFIQRMSMNPLVLGGIMTALDASRGGSGIEGFRAGAGTAAGIQDAWMKDYALRQQIEKEKAIRGLLASGQGMEGVPAPLLAIAKATGDVAPVVQHLTKSGTDDIKEYEYAVRGGFNGTFQQWMEKKKNMAGEYAKQLVYGTNAAGDIVPMQAGSKGDLTASKLPDGVKLQRDPIKMDAGTHYVLMDPTTRQPIGIVPKNVAEVERQKGVGDAQGKAQADLPKMESIAKSLIDKIDAVEKDPYLPNMVGTIAGRTPNVTEKARTLQSKIDQLKGYAFLQAFESLKGAGAITEVEGAKATQAMTRLHEMIQSGQDYREALRDFKSEVGRILDLKRTQARGVQSGGSVAAPVIQPPPGGATGGVTPVPGGGWSIQRVD